MQSIIIMVGVAVLVVIIVLMILIAPSMQKRGHRNPAEREQYERERRTDIRQWRGWSRYR